MSEQEADPERLLRVTRMMEHIKEGIEGQSLQDIQTAFANTIAQLCLSFGEKPDRIFLNTIDSCLEVYRDMSNLALREKDKDLS